MDSATNENSRNTGPAHEEVPGHRLIERVKELIADGNAKAVRVRTDDGKLFLEIPLTPAAITGGVVALAAPWVAVLAAIAALVGRLRLEIVPHMNTDQQ
jgi:hypothetical protein